MNAAKEFFKKCRWLNQRIDAKLEEMQRVREMAYRTTAIYSDDPRGGSFSDSKVERAVIRLAELENEINQAIDDLCEHRRMAKEIVDKLPDDRFRDVLSWRYFTMWSWEKIAEAMGCERMQVWRTHGRALAEAATYIADLKEPNSTALAEQM